MSIWIWKDVQNISFCMEEVLIHYYQNITLVMFMIVYDGFYIHIKKGTKRWERTDLSDDVVCSTLGTKWIILPSQWLTCMMSCLGLKLTFSSKFMSFEKWKCNTKMTVICVKRTQVSIWRWAKELLCPWTFEILVVCDDIPKNVQALSNDG